MDISYNQQKLFRVIDRSYMTDGVSGRPAERGVMTMNYTDKISARSNCNNPYERYNQLDMATHIGCMGKENSKTSLINPQNIECVSRQNEGASRFNYAYDAQIDKRMVDVSGILIPNNQLRIIPNRGTQLCYQKRSLPTNQAIMNLSQRIGDISAADLDKSFNVSNSHLKFKASRQKLTRQELLGLARMPTKGSLSAGRSIPSAPVLSSAPASTLTYDQLNNQPARNTRLSNYLTNQNNKGNFRWKEPMIKVSSLPVGAKDELRLPMSSRASSSRLSGATTRKTSMGTRLSSAPTPARKHLIV
jgi:hypothetical protein